DDGPVEPEAPGAAVPLDHAVRDVEVGRPPPEPEVEFEVVVRLLAQRDLVRLPFPRQQLLGKGRTVVREVGLGADEYQPAVVALASQCLGGAQPGEGGACDDERAMRGHDAGTLPAARNSQET